jgi:4-hydroxythreonine-4-phosphate dehydrogenase
MSDAARPRKPVIALAMGDPAGISAELTAKVLADAQVREAADIVVFGNARLLAEGERIGRVAAGATALRPGAPLDFDGRPILVEVGTVDPAVVTAGRATAAGGAFTDRTFRAALRLAHRGGADAVAFTPFNKLSMKMALGRYEDEIAHITEETEGQGSGREFNIIEGLWNARITSHVPLARVAALITREAVVKALELTDRCMRDAGFARPRIAVAALNPHAGDGGNFGREEIDVIEPAVAEAKAKGLAVEGPFPSDTVFLRARRGDFDAVQTMFHDQGQIAMKLIGFESGITLIGGYRFPICTPAHGTAFDIAGKGRANLGATRNALLIAARMARSSALAPEARGRLVGEITESLARKAA